MKDKPSNLNESLWRRKLSAAERAGLRPQPELALEARLTDALTKLSDVPVPSNFTARVLEAIDLETVQTERSRRIWSWRLLLPRMATATAVLLLAGVSYQHYETNSHRQMLAKNVAMVATAQPLPSVEALENLDAIQLMSKPVHADGELLADLQ